MSEEKVILVDKNDNQVGLMPKLEAHEKGVLHRAFSIFIFSQPVIKRATTIGRTTADWESEQVWGARVDQEQREKLFKAP